MYVYMSDVSIWSLGLSGFLMPDTVLWVGKFGVTDVFSGLSKLPALLCMCMDAHYVCVHMTLKHVQLGLGMILWSW